MITKETLETSLKDAIRSGDAVRKRTLRMILAAIKLAEVERRGPLDDAGMLGVFQREAKSRHETIADAERAGRDDLAAAAKAELALVESYLPRPLTTEELEALARQAITEVGASAPGEMGKVMRVLIPQVQGRADGKAVSDLVRGLLTPP